MFNVVVERGFTLITRFVGQAPSEKQHHTLLQMLEFHINLVTTKKFIS